MEAQTLLSRIESDDPDDFAHITQSTTTPTESIFTPLETARDEDLHQDNIISITRRQFSDTLEADASKTIKSKSPYEHTFLHVRDSGCAWQNEIIPVKDICDSDRNDQPSLSKLLGYFEARPHRSDSFNLHFDREGDVLVLNNEIVITNQRQFSGAFQYIMSKTRDNKTVSVRCHICRKRLLIQKSHRNFTWGDSLW